MSNYDDGWVGRQPKPIHFDQCLRYAQEYVNSFNEKIKKAALENTFWYVQYRTLSLQFHMDYDLREEKALGTYEPFYVLRKSSEGIVRIDIRRIGELEKIKETIRHEICHAISHQIFGQDCYHGKNWIEIAKDHNVNVSRYE